LGHRILQCLLSLLLVAVLRAGEKKLPIEQTSNELIEISASALTDRDQIQQEMGADIGADMVVVRVTVRPVSDKPILVSLDDFLLVSGKDGQRSQPFSPDQIAGSATLVVTPSGTRNGGLLGNPGGPTFGIPGLSRRGGGGAGNASSAPAGEAKVEAASTDNKTNPLLAILKGKVLPEKEITETISGLLYFQIVGKVKAKDLELHYKGPGGRLALRFNPR
jgi:hypothetical protein